METVYYIILVPMTYLAFAAFIAGTVVQAFRILGGYRYSVRYAIGPSRKPGTLGALYETFLMPSVLKTSPIHWVFLAIFHLAFLLLIIGHLELISEIGAIQVIEHEVFLGGGFVGIALLIATFFFIFRRFHSPVREISEPLDYYVLIILALVIIFGSQLHLARRIFDYSTVGVVEYRTYLSGLFSFTPRVPEIFKLGEVGHPFLLVLHVFFANLFLMLVPFTKIMHFLLSFPLKRLQRK